MGESRMIFPRFTLWISALVATGSLVQATVAAAEDGQLAFNNVCRTCHTLKEGDNRLGFAAKLQLFKCNETCPSGMGQGDARPLHQ